MQREIGASGRRAEKRASKRMGAGLTAASGATGQKGDMRWPGWLLEAKSTVGKSLGVTHSWLAKITHEATMAGRHPGLMVIFVDEAGRPKKDGAWVMVPERLFKELVEASNAKEG